MTVQRSVVVHAEWDAEAAVWVATSDDVPGLICEADSVDVLDAKLRMLIPELIELNGLPERFGPKPHAGLSLSLIAKRRDSLALAS